MKLPQLRLEYFILLLIMLWQALPGVSAASPGISPEPAEMSTALSGGLPDRPPDRKTLTPGEAAEHALAALLGEPPGVSPARPPGGAISVAEAILQAQHTDLKLQQLEKSLHQTRDTLSPQLRARLPRIFVEYEGSERYGLEEPYRLSHTLGAGIEVELTDQGSSWFSEQRKNRALEQLRLEIRLRKETITSQLLELCLDILYSKAVLVHMDQLLELYTRYLHSADQQNASATISAHSYRRLCLEFESKQLEMAAEELNLQNLYSQLRLFLDSDSPTIPQMKGSLPRIYALSSKSRLPSQPDYYQKAAQENNPEVIRQEIKCRSISDRRSFMLRQLCPQTVVFARIDLRGPEFPPASPSLSFGLQLSGGAGKLGLAAGNTSSYSSYTYAGNPSAHAAVDFSQKGAETRHMRALQLQQARQMLHAHRAFAGAQALRLFSELTHLKRVQKNLLAQSQLHRESCSIRAKQFKFGEGGLQDIVEIHQIYTESLLELYRVSRSRLEIECALLQSCGLSRHIPQVLESLNPASCGGSHALQ